MWTVARAASPSPLARSIDLSSRKSSYSESLSEHSEMWQPNQQIPAAKMSPTVHIAEVQARRRPSLSQISVASEATLAENVTNMDLKTPTVLTKTIELDVADIHVDDDAESEAEAETPAAPAGPIEAALLSLLSKVSLAERSQPTVMAADYAALQARVEQLESEKAHWMWRFEEMLAQRDQDVSNLLALRAEVSHARWRVEEINAARSDDLANLIKIRDELAHERRLHAEMRALRDEDLVNVQELRGQIAKAVWAQPKPEVHQHRARDSSSHRASIRPESELWQQAKTAALEQRLLELEKANEDLRTSAEAAGTSEGGVHVGRMEAIFDDHSRYRERMGMKVQQLRSEKEHLAKENAHLEDKAQDLEARLEKIQRRAL